MAAVEQQAEQFKPDGVESPASLTYYQVIALNGQPIGFESDPALSQFPGPLAFELMVRGTGSEDAGLSGAPGSDPAPSPAELLNRVQQWLNGQAGEDGRPALLEYWERLPLEDAQRPALLQQLNRGIAGGSTRHLEALRALPLPELDASLAARFANLPLPEAVTPADEARRIVSLMGESERAGGEPVFVVRLQLPKERIVRVRVEEPVTEWAGARQVDTALFGVDAANAALIERTLRVLDGTPDHSRLGPSTVLATIQAAATVLTAAPAAQSVSLGGESPQQQPLQPPRLTDESDAAVLLQRLSGAEAAGGEAEVGGAVEAIVGYFQVSHDDTKRHQLLRALEAMAKTGSRGAAQAIRKGRMSGPVEILERMRSGGSAEVDLQEIVGYYQERPEDRAYIERTLTELAAAGTASAAQALAKIASSRNDIEHAFMRERPGTLDPHAFSANALVEVRYLKVDGTRYLIDPESTLEVSVTIVSKTGDGGMVRKVVHEPTQHVYYVTTAQLDSLQVLTSVVGQDAHGQWTEEVFALGTFIASRSTTAPETVESQPPSSVASKTVDAPAGPALIRPAVVELLPLAERIQLFGVTLSPVDQFRLERADRWGTTSYVDDKALLGKAVDGDPVWIVVEVEALLDGATTSRLVDVLGTLQDRLGAGRRSIHTAVVVNEAVTIAEAERVIDTMLHKMLELSGGTLPLDRKDLLVLPRVRKEELQPLLEAAVPGSQVASLVGEATWAAAMRAALPKAESYPFPTGGFATAALMDAAVTTAIRRQLSEALQRKLDEATVAVPTGRQDIEPIIAEPVQEYRRRMRTVYEAAVKG